MTTTTKISKSEVMKSAHSLYKTNIAFFPAHMQKTFSECLKEAWKREKNYVETLRLSKEIARKNEERKRNEEIMRRQMMNYTPNVTYQTSANLSWGGIENFYGAGRYCGD